ncbi:MAG: hypothetical protein GY762_05975, partial [Proteobacteria bacterium]|nr:hypothetical protein [Pseudomonadota bacterium]
MKKMRVTAFPIAILILLLGGCSKSYIPNTEIEDNEFNREIISFSERYRR